MTTVFTGLENRTTDDSHPPTHHDLKHIIVKMNDNYHESIVKNVYMF